MDFQLRPFEESEVQFHLAEYNRLTGEINLRISESSNYEVTTAFGLAAYLGWYLTAQTKFQIAPISEWALVIVPILFFLAAICRTGYSYIKVRQAADYLKLVEGRLAHEQMLGWEHWRSENNRSPERRGGVYATSLSKNAAFLVAQCAIWGCIMLIGLAPLATKIIGVVS